MTENEHEQPARAPGISRGITNRISRRSAMVAMGGAGLAVAGGAVLAGTADASPGGAHPTRRCTLTPEETEGPYYLDLDLVRRDVTEGYPGVPLILSTLVLDTRRCGPVRNAAVDIWHCNALGEYSGYTAQGIGGGSGPGGGTPPTGTPTSTPTGTPPTGGGGHAQPTDNLTFLRGVQFTDPAGRAEFRTIYPGWYTGRAIHIHVKVHIGGTVSGGKYTGGHVSHTGQFYFDENVTDQIAVLQPYATNPVTRLSNQGDSIFTGGNDSGLLTLRPLHGPRSSVQHGVAASIVVGVDPAATPAAV